MRKNKSAQLLLISALLISGTTEAKADCPQAIGKIALAQGKVDVQENGTAIWLSARNDESICPGDTLRTSKWSRAVLSLKSGALLTVDQNTTMTFSAPQENLSSWFVNLMEGAAFFRSRQDQQLKVNTPFINAVHEGTEFLVAVSKQSAEISVFDGQVTGENKSGKVLINTGYKAAAKSNQPPTVQVLKITPQDAVQWALYYPAIIDETKHYSATESDLRASLSAYHEGDIQSALNLLNDISLTRQDTDYLTLKAALLLSIGRVDDAQPIIQQVQGLKPNSSDAFALQTIIAVAKNQQQAALDLGGKAVIADPQSAVAKIALSYAYQSQFNIDKAKEAVQTATQLAPDNALVWTRLAELQLSQGDREAALISAGKAHSLNPKFARIQTVLGFADLAQTNITKAKRAFEQALQLGSSDPLPRLGLGLAKIREGHVEEGKNDLETAVNLDPNNAVTRGYLGKAYYELRDKDYAGTEFNIAKAMDPKDPTPHFYDAILKQTVNRPVEALHDMQKAIELNDNRGVYRSKLLLDSDSAARSASLGRIYNDLGFQQRGLLEGWTSINHDPSNYSAHRLLADNYAALPRHEISRLSELLKAQLLQSVNITPVQPQAAESNILILDGLGSSITSFNEYNPLFTRDRFALQASGFYGSRDTISDEVVHSGVWDKFSYSLGQFHYETEGIRPNNYQKKDAYNAFGQVQVTADTNFQMELRHSEENDGDINQGFFVNQFSLDKNASRDISSVRGGLHHQFNQNSHLLASVVHRVEDFTNDDGGEVINSEAEGTQFELQHIYQRESFDLTGGMSYLSDRQGNLSSTLKGQDNPYLVLDSQLEQGAFYLYSNIKVIPKVTATVGFSQDFYSLGTATKVGTTRVEELDLKPFSPKFGLTWMVTDDTTFRLAAFRALKRGIVQKQTLEPTLLAGFNQFYDDLDGTISERVGFGLDHKFNSQFFAGAEVSKRFLEVPYQVVDTVSIPYFKTDWTEKNARAYVNFAPSKLLALGVNYNYEELNRNDQFFDNLRNQSNFFTGLETHRTQLFANVYHPLGFMSKLSLSYLNQTGNFFNTESFNIQPQSSEFWLLDAEIGYRLPKRHGLVMLGIKNLLDEKFNFQGTDLNYPMPVQGRYLYSRLTLSF
jgi:tetratricopeptide (TPR) repeat protein